MKQIKNLIKEQKNNSTSYSDQKNSIKSAYAKNKRN